MNRRRFLTSTAGVLGLAFTGGPGRAGRAVAADPAAGVMPAAAAMPATGPAGATRHSPEAKAVLKYLRGRFGKQVLAAQHGSQVEVDYVAATAGKTPAIQGTDLIFRYRDQRILNFARNIWKAGAIPTIMWHWGAPTIGDGYEQSKSKIDVNRCFEEGTPEHAAMWVDLKHRADFLTQLRDEKIPVLWRPLHECSGGWFWWDKSGPEAFGKLYRTMHDYFTQERGLDNLIWVLGFCGTPKPSYNPGAGYYDIVGGDTYDVKNPPWTDLFHKVQPMAPDGMPVTLHECAVPPTPSDAIKKGATWSWFMVWDSYIKKVDKAHLKAVYHDELVVTLDRLPKWGPLIAAEKA